METDDELNPIVNKMPPEWKQFEALIFELNLQWKLFNDLFQKEENFPVFNEVGTQMWHFMQPLLFDAVVLTLARFFDPAVMENRAGTKRCLSLEGVMLMPELRPYKKELKLAERINKMREIYKPAMREWRNNRLSHNNWEVVTKTTALPEIPYKHVEELIGLISEFANVILLRVNNYESGFCPMVMDWVENVVEVLKKGIDARQTEWDRLERGER